MSKIGRNLQIVIVFLIVFCYGIFSAIINSISPPCDELKSERRTYEEYHLEHQVSRQEAVAFLKSANESFFEAPQPLGCKAIPCNQSIMKYCLGPQFLNDHCWCEQGHANEGLPWVPHSCYVGDKIIETSVGSCFDYNEIKECCCDRALAKRWRFLSSSVRIEGSNSWIRICAPFMIALTTHALFFSMNSN